MSNAVCVAAGRGDLQALINLVGGNVAYINVTDKDGDTPLHLASLGGHLDVLRWLHTNGANLSARSKNGGTPRDYAKNLATRAYCSPNRYDAHQER